MIGKAITDSNLKELGQAKILMIQRGEHAEHGPFYGFILEDGDILVVSISREQLTKGDVKWIYPFILIPFR